MCDLVLLWAYRKRSRNSNNYLLYRQNLKYNEIYYDRVEKKVWRARMDRSRNPKFVVWDAECFPPTLDKYDGRWGDPAENPILNTQRQLLIEKSNKQKMLAELTVGDQLRELPTDLHGVIVSYMYAAGPEPTCAVIGDICEMFRGELDTVDMRPRSTSKWRETYTGIYKAGACHIATRATTASMFRFWSIQNSYATVLEEIVLEERRKQLLAARD